jgi:HlyD family secretion protein
MNAHVRRAIDLWAAFGRTTRARLGWSTGEDTWTAQDFAPLQPTLDDILAERPPPWLRSSHVTVVGLFVGMILISSVVRVDMIVSASGRLTTDSPTIVVQPMHTSIVREIRVRPGDAVRKGEVLATLDPTFAQADKDALQAQNASLSAQIARLEAEMQDQPFEPTGTTPEVKLQLTLFLRRQAQYRARLRAFDEEIARYEASIGSTETNRTSLAKQTDIAREVEAMRAKLYQLQSGSKLTLLDAQASRMRSERDFQDADSKLTDMRHMLRTRRAERDVFVEEWRRQILEELMRARADAKNVSESLIKATRMNDLVVLTAPEDGVVLELGRRSVGSVVQEAEPVVTMVSSTAPLIADVMIASADVGYTRNGDEVQLKVDAFPYQRHGLLTGKLKSIGQDSITQGSSANLPPAGASSNGVFHRSRVELAHTVLHNQPQGANLIPGMTVTAEIKVGTRSVISYFIYPLLRGFTESMREP